MNIEELQQLIEAHKDGKVIEHKELGSREWQMSYSFYDPICIDSSHFEYRIKPSVPKLNPLSISDLPPVCFVKTNPSDSADLITGFSHETKQLIICGHIYFTIAEAIEKGYRWSPDPHAPWDQWKPFSKQQ